MCRVTSPLVQASLTITAQPQTITYGASVPATTVTYDGFVNGDTADSLTTQPTVVSAQSGVVAAEPTPTTTRPQAPLMTITQSATIPAR